MTASDGGELVATLLMVMCIPQIIEVFEIMISRGGWLLTQVESDTITLMLMPLIGVCCLAWLIMGVGYWIDSGGLDV